MRIAGNEGVWISFCVFRQYLPAWSSGVSVETRMRRESRSRDKSDHLRGHCLSWHIKNHECIKLAMGIGISKNVEKGSNVEKLYRTRACAHRPK